MNSYGVSQAAISFDARGGLMKSAPRNGWHWQFLVRSPRIEAGSGAPVESAGTANECRRSVKMARLEAVLLVADQALSFRKLAQFATLADASEAQHLVKQLNAAYDKMACAFRVEQLATGCRLMTRPQFAMWLDKLHQRHAEMKLSPPMLETLTIVAYRQPITRAEIEKIRGVQAAEMLKQLMERGLVRIGGEDDSLGRPFLYETTRRFLESYGLKDLGDLPQAEKLQRTRDPQLKLNLADDEIGPVEGAA